MDCEQVVVVQLVHYKHRQMPVIQKQLADDKAPEHRCQAVVSVGVQLRSVNFPTVSYFEAVYDDDGYYDDDYDDDGDILVYYLKR